MAAMVASERIFKLKISQVNHPYLECMLGCRLGNLGPLLLYSLGRLSSRLSSRLVRGRLVLSRL